jgi:hypothetical protein
MDHAMLRKAVTTIGVFCTALLGLFAVGGIAAAAPADANPPSSMVTVTVNVGGDVNGVINIFVGNTIIFYVHGPGQSRSADTHSDHPAAGEHNDHNDHNEHNVKQWEDD